MSAVVSGTNVYSVGPNSPRTRMGFVSGVQTSVTFPVAFSAAPYSVQLTAAGL